MSRTRRTININPTFIYHYIIDANFLINKYLDPKRISDINEKRRVINCKNYWENIDSQLRKNKAKIFILDICIAEVFKILSKKYYNGYFANASSYKWTCDKLRRDICLSYTKAKKLDRKIKFHDIQLNRDIIIGIDRFFENINKKGINVSIVDILILSAAKYLLDFYSLTHDNLIVITIDNELYKIGKQFNDLPYVFNPNNKNDLASKVFI